ncbi:hypothetical protein O6H91_05G123000 [Diphasiastrum complanatum]|uniref:Uncharacterized protein n=1 Tax=Diphasiastrum complanatum TaxID=34168 RepID=A0ACC2DSZ8_DIPCM|nr:hypothetical protein O6H91_05G123000 [Diphasiastrum complanatum]
MAAKVGELGRRRLGFSLAAVARQTSAHVRFPPDLKSRIDEFLKDYSLHYIEQKLARVKATITKRNDQELSSNYKLKNQYQDGKKVPRSRYAKRMTLSAKHRPEYEKEETAGYVASLMPATYASVYRVLSEVRCRLPNFQPVRVLDFGSGPGTAIWALREVWPGVVQRAHLVEISPDMTDACATLLQGVQNAPRTKSYESLRHVCGRVQGENLRHDLVICSHSLGELPSMVHRMAALRLLWSLTHDILVIIEPGTPHGSALVRRIRHRVLMWEAKKVRRLNKGLYISRAKRTMVQKEPDVQEGRKTPGSFVVSPCAHDGVCPMDKTRECCFFSLGLDKTLESNLVDQGFSYVILRRGSRPRIHWPLDELSEILSDAKLKHAVVDSNTKTCEILAEEYSPDLGGGWARIVRPPEKHDNMINLEICCASNQDGTEGQICDLQMSKYERSSLSDLANVVEWGDLWPCSTPQKAV